MLVNGRRNRSRHSRLQVGDRVVSTKGRVEGVDPFTPLIVTAVHRDGTVNVAVAPTDPREWTRVPAWALLEVPPHR